LDLLRDELRLTGAKKGCDHGACTMHVDGQRVLSCLTLAATLTNHSVRTIEGVGTPENLHPVQQAVIDHDAFQRGFCTPGQIMSALTLLDGQSSVSRSEIRNG
jgi:xanthine dehydrogenase YagT iron-sulfur-binding subunit